MNLKTRIDAWVAAGLITSEQAVGITAFEAARPKKSWALLSVMLLGSFVLAVGIVSLIAANWQFIGGTTKLAVDGALLVALAGLMVRFYDDKNSLIFQITHFIFIGAILASIGLVSQVYHQGGYPYEALSLWLIIITPVALFTRNAAIPHLYAGSLLTTAISFMEAFGPFGDMEEGYLTALVIVTPFAFGALAQLVSVLKGPALFASALRRWFILTLVVAAAFTDLFLTERQFYRGLYTPEMQNTALIAATALFGFSLTLSWSKRDRIVLGVSGAVLLLAYFLLIGGREDEVVGALVSLAIGSGISLLCVLRARGRLFNAMVVLLGARFLIVYFQVFGSLAMTGVGLVISGILIMGAAFVGFKYQKRLYRWLEGAVK